MITGTMELVLNTISITLLASLGLSILWIYYTNRPESDKKKLMRLKIEYYEMVIKDSKG